MKSDWPAGRYSKGCNVEKYTAETYGKQIWEIDQFDEIKLFGL